MISGAKRYLFFSLCNIMVVASAPAEVGGHIKGYLLAGDHVVSAPADGMTDFSSLLTFRGKWKDTFGARIQIDFAYAGSAQYVDSYKAVTIPSIPVYRIDDIESAPSDVGSNYFFYRQNLDRLSVSWSGLNWTLSAGRQALSFGSGRVVNPTDTFFAFSLASLDQEYRQGLDLIRAKRELGDMGELDLGIVFGEQAKAIESALFVLWRQVYSNWDLAIMAQVFREHQLLGWDLQGDLWQQGVWWELALTKIQEDKVLQREGGEYLRSVVGMDYRISNSNTILFLEYHYNGAGESDSVDYTNLVNRAAYFDGAIFLQGKNYLAPGASVEITPLLNYVLSGILNIDDDSVYLNQVFSYSLADEWALDLMWLYGNGAVSSEFEAFPSFGLLSVRGYF